GGTFGGVRGGQRRIGVVGLVARGARGGVRHLLVVVPERFRVRQAGRRDLVREERDEGEAIRVRPVPGVRSARGPAEVPKRAGGRRRRERVVRILRGRAARAERRP